MSEKEKNLQGYSQGSFAADSQSGPLNPGIYDVWGDEDVEIYIAVRKTTPVAVTSANGYLVRANTTAPVKIASTSYIGGTGTGNIHYHQVG